MKKPINETRALNMELRRKRIIEAAREIITSDGFDTLTTRKLAAAAGVTTPTLYNLIGSMDDIFTTLVEQCGEKVRSHLDNLVSDLDGLTLFQETTNFSIDVLCEDAATFKAIGLATERRALVQDASAVDDSVLNATVPVFLRAIQRAKETGQLLGRIDEKLLAEYCYATYRAAYIDWCRGLSNDAIFRARAHHGTLVCLLADAKDEARNSLLESIGVLEMKLSVDSQLHA